MADETNVDAIRTAITEKVEKYGLRYIARQIGMSPSGLQKFVAGANPYQKTLRKIIIWSDRHGAGDQRSPEEILIDELVAPLPERGRDETRAEIMRVLAAARRHWRRPGNRRRPLN